MFYTENRKTKAIFLGWVRSGIRCQFAWSVLKWGRPQSHILVWNSVNVSSMCPHTPALTFSKYFPRAQCHDMTWHRSFVLFILRRSKLYFLFRDGKIYLLPEIKWIFGELCTNVVCTIIHSFMFCSIIHLWCTAAATMDQWHSELNDYRNFATLSCRK